MVIRSAVRVRSEEFAFRLLYQRYSPRVFGFLYRLSGRRHVADNLHQETWVSVACHAADLREDSDLAAWLFTIARNQYRSWCRTRARDEPSLPAFDREQESDWPATAPAQESLHDLERALRALPAPSREVLLLMGCEGLDTAQTARVLDISPQAVRQRLSPARAALLAALSADQLSATRVRGKGAP